MKNKTEFEKGYAEGISDALTVIYIAQEKGETDIRQVVSWVERAAEFIEEEEGEV